MKYDVFLDSCFRYFSEMIWNQGISIYRSGGVNSIEVYGELISAKVKAGIGDNHNVRIKAQPQGRIIQWMECTCQLNRMKGVKCEHLAAFCITIDQEKPNILKQFHLGTGSSDLMKFVFKPIPHPENNDSEKTNKKKTSTVKDEVFKNPYQSNMQNLISGKDVQLLSIDPDGELPFIKVTVSLMKGKEINYRCGLDDALELLFNPVFSSKINPSLQKWLQPDATAKRFFYIKREELSKFKIIKGFIIKKGDGQILENTLLKYPSTYIGYYGVFHKKLGYIKFNDDFNQSKLSKWHSFGLSFTLPEELVVPSLENNFQEFKNICDVKIDKSVQDCQILENVNLSSLKVKSASLSNLPTYLINADFAMKDQTRKKGNSGSLAEIIKARKEGKQFIALEKGIIKIDEKYDWLQKKLQDDGQLKLNSTDFIKFHMQFKNDGIQVPTPKVIFNLTQGIVARENLPLPKLTDSNLSLRPYQEEGLRWLWWLYSNSLSGLLADEMGLGKTHQAMALLSSINEPKKDNLSLVVCPTSVIDHWLSKLAKFTPNLKVTCYHGTTRKESLNFLSGNHRNHHILVTSYGILLRDIEKLKALNWNVVILDEAHLVKNQSTRTYRAACQLKSKMRLCLTGTPLENDLMELKNLFDYIVPLYLGTNSEFKKKFVNPDTPNTSFSKIELQKLIYPFKVRRNKKDVLTDLPEKIEDYRYCQLNPEQKKIYLEALNLKGAKIIDEIKNPNQPIPLIHIFSLITLLKQICDDPALIHPDYEHVGSGKLAALDELLQEAIESQQKVVIFSQYAKMVKRLSDRFTRQNIKHISLTGSSINRGSIVREFQENDKVQVFVGSLLAGGTGIDLTSASIVIHFDRWWNAAKENQATDRIHRIGQTKNVQVYKFITKGTIEERIDEIIFNKRRIFEQYIEKDEEVFKSLSREELLQLLIPSQNLESYYEDPFFDKEQNDRMK